MYLHEYQVCAFHTRDRGARFHDGSESIARYMTIKAARQMKVAYSEDACAYGCKK